MTQPSIEVSTYAATDGGLGVNSHLLMGAREAMLIDTQFLVSEAQRVIEWVKGTGKQLTTIFLTHEHPDHHFGTKTIKAAFPGARVLATAATAEAIAKTAEAKMAQWRPVYGDDIPNEIEHPEPHVGATLEFEGRELSLIELGAGESETGTVLHLPEEKLLLSADFVYHQVFAWIVANHPDRWVVALRALDALANVERVLPGHGPPGGRALITDMIEYLKAFADIVGGSADAAAAKSALRGRYPRHRLAIMMELSVDDAFARRR